MNFKENRFYMLVLRIAGFVIGLSLVLWITFNGRSNDSGGQRTANSTRTALAMTAKALLGPFPTSTVATPTASDTPTSTPIIPTATPTVTRTPSKTPDSRSISHPTNKGWRPRGPRYTSAWVTCNATRFNRRTGQSTQSGTQRSTGYRSASYGSASHRATRHRDSAATAANPTPVSIKAAQNT